MVLPEHTLFICGILFMAGILQGTAGFGYGLIGVGVLGRIMPIPEVSALIALSSLITNMIMLWKLWPHFRWDKTGPILTCTMIGSPIGVFFLVIMDPGFLRWILAGFLMIAALYNLAPHLAKRPWHPVWLGVPCGLLSGILNGTFGTGGPPLIAYFSSQGMSRFRFSATLQLIFVCSNLPRMFELIRRGMLVGDVLWLSLLSMPLSIVGIFVGMRILEKLSPRRFQIFVGILVFILGLENLRP